MSPGQISAVLVNWRTATHTIRAARALIADGIPAERVVVVDNASGDGSAAALRDGLTECRVLELAENLGFAGANNLAASQLPSSDLLLVNSDAFVHRHGSVARLAAALERDSIGIAVPRLLNADLSLQYTVVPNAAPLPELVRASGLSRLLPNRLQPRFGTHWDHASSQRIEAAMGAVLLIRAEAWAELGGFDERRFMYAEDLDLFLRAAAAGWEARFVAEATFVHLGGASTAQRWDDAQRAERVARAQAAVVRAHLGPLRSKVTLAIMAAGVGARAIIHAILGDRDAAREQAGWFRGFVGRPARGDQPQ